MLISNTLLPNVDDTALSPNPCCATMMAESMSGTEVPAARKVRPMITEGMPAVAPIIMLRGKFIKGVKVRGVTVVVERVGVKRVRPMRSLKECWQKLRW